MAVELPSGTVTFLFTDIEDSTRRWEQEPAAMSAALARHDHLLRQAVSVNRGAVFATGGDGMAVVFGRAGDAIAAAVAAQRAFEIELVADRAARADGRAHRGGRRTRW